MRLIKTDPFEYYISTLNAFKWVGYDLYLDTVVTAIKNSINANDPDLWNIHIALNYLARTLSPETYLEIGTRRGRSLFQVLEGSKNIRKVVSIDIYQESHFLDLKNDVDDFLRMTGKDVEIVYYKEPSGTALKKINDKFDMITIDGSHHYDTALNDLKLSSGLLKDKGAIIVDDTAQMPYLGNMVSDFQKEHEDFDLISTDQLYGCSILYKGIAL